MSSEAIKHLNDIIEDTDLNALDPMEDIAQDPDAEPGESGYPPIWVEIEGKMVDVSGWENDPFYYVEHGADPRTWRYAAPNVVTGFIQRATQPVSD